MSQVNLTTGIPTFEFRLSEYAIFSDDLTNVPENKLIRFGGNNNVRLSVAVFIPQQVTLMAVHLVLQVQLLSTFQSRTTLALVLSLILVRFSQNSRVILHWRILTEALDLALCIKLVIFPFIWMLHTH